MALMKVSKMWQIFDEIFESVYPNLANIFNRIEQIFMVLHDILQQLTKLNKRL
jgi:hypothetical protein